MSSISRFHLAFPVDDLEVAQAFYTDVLGCKVGRTDATWVDLDLYGHQIVAHLSNQQSHDAVANKVDGDDVPVPHFGLILEWNEWEQLADRVRTAGITFVIKPHVRFAGKPGEQATMFFRDPAGNALEFKAFRDERQIFATE
jgi:uncharacterized protein